jgi:hypothetical protein
VGGVRQLSQVSFKCGMNPVGEGGTSSPQKVPFSDSITAEIRGQHRNGGGTST